MAEGAIVRHGEITAGDVDDRGRSAEGVHARESQRAGSGLGEHDIGSAGHSAGNHSRQDEPIREQRGAGAAHAVGDTGRSPQGKIVGQKKSVVVAVRQRQAEVCAGKRGRLQDLMQRLIIGEAARAADSDVRHHACLEDHVADCDRLE